jgi:hypothetical protein
LTTPPLESANVGGGGDVGDLPPARISPSERWIVL